MSRNRPPRNRPLRNRPLRNRPPRNTRRVSGWRAAWIYGLVAEPTSTTSEQ